MNQRHVISSKNLPIRWSPISNGMLWYLMLSHLQAPGWVFSMVAAFWMLCAVAVWSDLFNREEHTLLNSKGERL